MKYSQRIGVLAAVLLVVSCAMNWAWYPDIHKYFTGFSSEGNQYGKPGKLFIILSAIAVICYLLPKIWAKRWNVLVCCVVVAFAIRTFLVYTACYHGTCPEKQFGIWLMLGSAVLMILAALLPDLKVSGDEPSPGKSHK